MLEHRVFSGVLVFETAGIVVLVSVQLIQMMMMMMMMMMMVVAFGATSVNSTSFCHGARFYKANDSKELPHLGVVFSAFVGNI